MPTRLLTLLVDVSAVAHAQGPPAPIAAFEGPHTGRDGELAALRR